MNATYTTENSKRKEGSTNEKRRIQLCSNEIQTIEPIFESKIRKEGDSMSPAPPPERGRKVRGVRCTNKKRCIQSYTNKIQTIESIFESKIRNGGYSMSPAPVGRGRKVRGVQTKKDVYNHIQTKYKRLSPFSNPKSEMGDIACPQPQLGEEEK